MLTVFIGILPSTKLSLVIFLAFSHIYHFSLFLFDLVHTYKDLYIILSKNLKFMKKESVYLVDTIKKLLVVLFSNVCICVANPCKGVWYSKFVSIETCTDLELFCKYCLKFVMNHYSRHCNHYGGVMVATPASNREVWGSSPTQGRSFFSH